MAGGNLSARQKMINLMYLIFIAMLALNMDKKVLTSFGFMKDRLAASNEKVANANNEILTNLNTKAFEQPEKYAKLDSLAKSIKETSDNYYKYLDEVKTELKGKVEDPSDYESMDVVDPGDNYFFKGDSKPSEKGQKFVDGINNYRNDIVGILGEDADSELKTQIEERFQTPDEVVKDGKKKIPWLNSRYELFPLITTLANIEQIQADIRTTESEIYNSLFSGKLISEVSMTKYQAMVVFDKSAFYSNERLTGKIVLGKNDPTLTAERVVINGSEVPKANIQAGQVVIDRSAGNVGEHELKGEFVFIEDGVEVPIEIVGGKYSVIPRPNEAVISADKMNVVYRGLSNPLTISIPGIPNNRVTASGSGLQNKGGGKYVMIPGQGNEVSITATGKMSDGKSVSSSKSFRIMDIPAPMGAIRKQTGSVSMPKASLAKATVGVVLPDFVFDLTLRTTSFKIKVPGQATVIVNGARMDSKAQGAIAKAKRGDMVSIFDIKSSLVGSTSGYRIKDASPVMIEIK